MIVPSIGIIVLAAGASSRMGESKQLLPFEGETLLSRSLSSALNSRASHVIVVLGSDVDRVRDDIENIIRGNISSEKSSIRLKLVFNEAWTEGIGSSIRSGITALEELTAGAADGALIMLCDQPFVSSVVLDRLIAAYASDQSPAGLAASEYGSTGKKTYGVPAIFSRALFRQLKNLEGKEGAKRVITEHSDKAIFVPVPEAAFDVDTPADYQRLRGINHPLG